MKFSWYFNFLGFFVLIFEFRSILNSRFRLDTTFRGISVISEKNIKPKCKLKNIFIFFDKPLIHKSIRNTRKTSFWFKDIVIFIICVYTGFTNPKTCVKKLCIIKSSLTIKNNEVKWLICSVCSKDISLLCFVISVALVLFRCWKKTI